jgi:hypothetical protein
MSFGVLMTTASDDPESEARLAAFVKALKELGWTDGRNVQFHFRFGTGVATTGKGTTRWEVHPNLLVAGLTRTIIQPFKS